MGKINENSFADVLRGKCCATELVAIGTLSMHWFHPVAYVTTDKRGED